MLFRPRIVGVVTGSLRRDEEAWESLARCDWAEFRADTFGTPDQAALPDLLGALSHFREEAARRLGRVPETLVTFRLRRDGGEWPDTEAARRLPAWQALAAASDPASRACEWIDVEAEEAGTLPESLRRSLSGAGIKLLLSQHDFRRSYPLPELRARLRALLRARPDGVKFALTCRDEAEVLDLIAYAREVAGAIENGSVFSMGGPGRATRALSPLLGCPLTYAFLTGAPVAPGQLSARDLRAFYDTAKPAAVAAASADPRTLLSWAESRLQEIHHA
ncbi:MAG TPA: type I 3-dehydroquinate dehydratase [Fibrobacteria bacterium]|nr:type I 3-dehydroquinate dehydratase [Fibrobacteria bacterium]